MKLFTPLILPALLLTFASTLPAQAAVQPCDLRFDATLNEAEQDVAERLLANKFNVTNSDSAPLTLKVTKECEHGSLADFVQTRCMVKAKIFTRQGNLYNQKNRYSATAAELKFETLSLRLFRRALRAMEKCEDKTNQ